MSVPKGLIRAFTITRVAVLLVLVPYALDWRSPFLASTRVWALLGLIAIPLAIGLVDVRALRRPAGRLDRALSSASFEHQDWATFGSFTSPSPETRGRLRWDSRFPFGLQDRALAALLQSSGQTQPDVITAGASR